MTATRTDGRLERGRQTRRLVLGRTMEIASVEGLEGLSIGRVAAELGLSKSGVFALFGSKEELQLATVRAATAVYVEHVVRPAEETPAGLGRVCALIRNWLAYSRERVFPGGCFFFSSSVEFGAREGAVHDALAARRTEWTGYVRRTLEEARVLGGLHADTDVDQLAFELIALLETANVQSVLSRDDAGYDRAAAGMLARLRAAATDPQALPDTLAG
ncbi:TetR/AcrR family transcriptional regulator [Streptomyces sp. YIM 98790]|uniref:TetR/AcrR family transcriptional regulator n=1 Tax=Streptomyces sp. YIM 98790 TaxID=2689077 RepID=UPI0014082E21|nr:TetR/AcrR family transcriptional regulator [Streptomyces sp. YIM 98790]